MNEEKKEIIAEGRFVNFVRRGHWEYAERPGIAGIVLIVPVFEDQLVLVEQYRPPARTNVIELPAGLAGDLPGQEDEELEMAAARELEEETGFRAGCLERLVDGFVSAGITDEKLTLFLASDLVKISDGGGDASEDITVHVVPIASTRKWLLEQQAKGKAIDLKIYAGLHFAAEARRGKSS